MALYSIRSERQFCERLKYDLLFRWFLDLNPDEPAFDHSTFSQNQARLLQHQVADLFFAEVVWLDQRNGWISDQHFSGDATLIEAWASLKSFKPKGTDHGTGGGNGWTDFKGQSRRNDTHAATTDPEAKLVRKGDGRKSRLAFAGHATMDNRHGLCVLFEVHPAVGAPESQVAVRQIAELQRRGVCSAHGRGGPRLLLPRVRRGLAGTGRDPAPGPAARADPGREGSLARPLPQSTSPAADRGDLRLDQDHRLPPQNPLPGRATHPRGRPVRRGRLQPDPDGPPVPGTAANGAGLTPATAGLHLPRMNLAPNHLQNRRRNESTVSPRSTGCSDSSEKSFDPLASIRIGALSTPC